MAEEKVSARTALAASAVATDDLIPIVDTSAVESKSMTVAEMRTAMNASMVPATLADSAAPTGGLYYSSDQSGLTYKDAGDVLRRAADILIPSAVAATNSANIAAAIAATGHCELGPGTFATSETITLDADGESIRGVGEDTIITPNGSFAAITITGDTDYCHVADLYLYCDNTGLYGIDLNDASNVRIANVHIDSPTSHGIFLRNNSWVVNVNNCVLKTCGGSGIHAISDATYSNGNALSVHDTSISFCTGNGIDWCAASLSVKGCDIESNLSGVKLSCVAYSPSGAEISGNYFEANTASGIELQGNSTYSIVGVNIQANYINSPAAAPCIYSHTTDASTLRIRSVTLGWSNVMTGSGSTDLVSLSKAVGYSLLNVGRSSWDEDVDIQLRNTITSHEARDVVTEHFTVACNSDKTAAAPTIITLPDGSTILEITAECTEEMDGSGAKTFEVGVSGNIDKYIDAAEFNPASLGDIQGMTWGGSNDQATSEVLTANTAVLATWTNTGGTPSAGAVLVRVTYSVGSFYTNAIAVPA